MIHIHYNYGPTLRLQGNPDEMEILCHTLQDRLGQAHTSASGCTVWRKVDPAIRKDGELITVPGYDIEVLTGAFIWLFPDLVKPLLNTYKERARTVETRGTYGTSVYEDLVTLGYRMYQINAIRCAVESGYGILDIAMGGGKTRIAFGLALACKDAWLYIVHGRDLVAQATAEFTSLMERTANVQITAASWKQALRLIDERQYEGVIIDECHGVATEERMRVLFRLRCRYRIGLSGTPLDRIDGRNALVIGLLGPVLYSISVSDLVRDGKLTPGRVFFIK